MSRLSDRYPVIEVRLILIVLILGGLCVMSILGFLEARDLHNQVVNGNKQVLYSIDTHLQEIAISELANEKAIISNQALIRSSQAQSHINEELLIAQSRELAMIESGGARERAQVLALVKQINAELIILAGGHH